MSEALEKEIEALQVELGKVAVKRMRIDDQRWKLFAKIQQLESELRDLKEKGK